MRRAVLFGLAATAILSIGFIALSHAKAKGVPDWTPPKTTVAKELVETGRFLLNHGFGDPRGGKLGIASVRMSGSWSEKANDVRLLGWIKDDGGKKVLIDMAGITYPAQSVIEEFKTEDAVENALKLLEDGKTNYAGPLNRLMPFYIPSTPNDGSKFGELLSDQAVVQLLIHGDTDLAERLYAKRVHLEYEGNKTVQKPGLDKYAEYSLLSRFLSAYWVAAVNAHMRGDDELAYQMANTLVDNADEYEKFGASLQTGMVFMPDETTGKKTMFSYILPADQLAKDSERRMKEGAKTVDMASLDKMSSKDRVAKLIELLDQVSARQWGQPGGVNLADDRIVQALIKEGNVAGDALLDCIEKDTRLTRSVSFGRDFFPTRNLLTVKSAAFAAFCGITQIDAYGPNMRRQPTVADLRGMWAKNKNLIPAERWFNVLKDDKSSHQQWVAAAQWLAEPKDVMHKGGGWVTIPKQENGKPVSPSKFTDLPVAKKTELPKLLEQRARTIEQQNTDPSTRRLHEHDMALQLAVIAHQIQPSKPLALLKELMKLAMDEKTHYAAYIGEINGERLSASFAILIAAKEPRAIEDYLDWLMSCKQEFFFRSSIFKPLEQMPPDKANKAVGDLLTLESSVYNVKTNLEKQGPHSIEQLLSSPLILYRSFRSMYLDLLKDKAAIGSVDVDEERKTVTIKGKKGWQMGTQQISESDLPEARRAVCRTCDYFAKSLSYMKGAPAFSIYWSETRKDAAIKELASFLANQWQDIVKDLRERYRF